MSARPKLVAVPSGPAIGHDEAAVAVLRQFRQVFNAVKSHFQQVEKTVGMGGAQVWALSVVREQPGIGVGALARAMSIHQSTASNLVRTLIDREMLVAVKQGADRRAVQLNLLPAGARVLRNAPGPFAGLLPDVLKALPPETLARLQADLDQVIVKIAADEAAGHVPLSQV
ncbi:MAG: MarR family winged helix-turn-helix transcriptional regulator [Burkholderiaceae bacterium]|jgi:DNA-binding MarR family transcriptional regulator|nr:winged helix-turn-helix transcriptional regulator [Massilia sp.]